MNIFHDDDSDTMQERTQRYTRERESALDPYDGALAFDRDNDDADVLTMDTTHALGLFVG